MFEIPKQIKYKGNIYDVNAKHKNILKIIEYLEDDNLDDVDRAIMLVTRVFGIHAPVEKSLVEFAKKIIMLDRSEEEHSDQKRDMDFIHDYNTIRMDLIRDYNIDIAEVDVNWDWFFYAVENLNKDSSLNNIRQVRNMKLSTVKGKEREDLKRLKKQLALPDRNAELNKKLKEKQDNLIKKLI